MTLKIACCLLMLMFSCRPAPEDQRFVLPGDSLAVALEKKSPQHYQLRVYRGDSLCSFWSLPYPVYRLDSGDVNNDGHTDILAGVIKATRFDPVVRKRLFIFQLKNHYVRPLWLGSRLAHPLEDFCFIAAGQQVGTIEAERDGRFLVARYRWRGFGLEFIGYKKRNISREEALHCLRNL